MNRKTAHIKISLYLFETIGKPFWIFGVGHIFFFFYPFPLPFEDIYTKEAGGPKGRGGGGGETLIQ